MSRAASARVGTGSPPKSNATRALPSGYFAQAELPLASLALVLPLLVLYEVGIQLSQLIYRRDQPETAEEPAPAARS